MTQEEWDKRFLKLTKEVATWSSCFKEQRHVGAVIVKDRRVVATGYNGAPAGIETCKDRGYCHKATCGIDRGTCNCYAVHAEQNAILQAAKLGINIEGTTLYCTHEPCDVCAKLIINSGIKRVVYITEYGNEWSRYLLSLSNVSVEKYNGEI